MLLRFIANTIPNQAEHFLDSNSRRLQSAQFFVVGQTKEKEGGRILAAFETSLYDERGNRLQNYQLADLFGLDFVARSDERDASRYGPLSRKGGLPSVMSCLRCHK